MLPLITGHYTQTKRQKSSFTLAELLIALILLFGMITLTIPPASAALQNQQYNAAAKEVSSALGSAYANYKRDLGDTPVGINTSAEALKPYLNYMKVETTSTLQDHPGASDVIWDFADENTTCLKMPSGGTLYWFKDQVFNGTDKTNGLTIYYDPDGANVGDITQSNPSVSVLFILHCDGHIVNKNKALPDTTNSYWTFGPCESCNPDWFHW